MLNEEEEEEREEKARAEEEKEKARTKAELGEEKEELGAEEAEEAEEGLIIVLNESQESVVTHRGEKEKLVNKGLLTIKNLTGGPIYDFELNLRNIDNTDLDETIEEAYLKEFETEGKQIDYSVITDRELIVDFSEELDFKEGLITPVAIYEQETPFLIHFSMSNKTNGPLKLTTSKELHEKMDIPQLPTVEKGKLSKNGQLKWEIPSMSPNEEAKVSIEGSILSKDTEEIGSGEIMYEATGEDFTISGVEVDSVKAGVLGKVKTTTDKEERLKERGVWDVRIHVENESTSPIRATGLIGVMTGKVLGGGEGEEGEEEEEIPGRIESPIPGKREYPRVVSNPVSVEPGEEKIIGPFPIRSEVEPNLTTDVEYEIIPKIVKKVTGKSQIREVSIPVLSGKLSKELEVKHPPAAAGLSAKELMSNLEEPVEVQVKLENTGSAGIDYCQLSEVLPAGFRPPKRDEIEISLKSGEMEPIEVPEENVELEITPEKPTEENELKIAVSDLSHVFEHPMRKGDFITVKYEITALKPEAGQKYDFPCTAYLSVTPADRPKSFVLDEPPVLETARIERKIRKSKKVAPGTGEKEFVVTAVLRNDGDLPARNYEFKDLIPSNFEFIEESAEPQPSRTRELPDGIEARWAIEKIPADGRKEIKYTVRGRQNFKVSNLTKVRD